MIFTLDYLSGLPPAKLGYLLLNPTVGESHTDFNLIVNLKPLYVNSQVGTALHLSVYYNYYDAFQEILKQGIDVNIQNLDPDSKRGALHVAASLGRLNMCRDLIEAGAEVDLLDADDSTALSSTASRNHPDVCALLLEHGSDINHQDYQLWTALHCAAARDHLEVCRLLISRGADLRLKNDDDDRPWDLASDTTREHLPELEP